MWRYSNPVAITFGSDAFAELPKLIGGQPYALVTYPDAAFAALAERLRTAAGEPAVTVSDVAPNPDTKLLAGQSARFSAAGEPKAIVALGGGSVIDTAKVLAGRAVALRLCCAISRPAPVRKRCRRRRSSQCRPRPVQAAKSRAGRLCGTRSRGRSIRCRGPASIPSTPWSTPR